MRVIYMLSEDLKRTGSGMVHFNAVARGMKQLGHDVKVLGPRYHRKMQMPEGLSGWLLPVPGRNVFSLLLYQIFTVLVFPWLLLLYRPHAILIRGGMDLLTVLFPLARLVGVAVVVELNGVPYLELAARRFGGFLAAVVKFLMVLECRLASRVIPVSPQIGQVLVEQCNVPREKIFPIQNGADPDAFTRDRRRETRASIGADDSGVVFGFVGDFAPWHGVPTLMDAISLLPEDMRGLCRFVLVGSGEYWQEASARAKASPWATGIHLTGEATRAQVKDWLGACDVGILVNTPGAGMLGSPLKFWEYLAAGLSIILSDHPALSPVVKKYDMGWIVPELTPPGIARAITTAFEQRDRIVRMGQSNRQHVIEEFSWLEVSRKVLRVLDGKTCGDLVLTREAS